MVEYDPSPISGHRPGPQHRITSRERRRRRRAAERERERLAIERQAESLKGVPGDSGSPGMDPAPVDRNGQRLRQVEEQLRDAQKGSVPDTNARTSNLERPSQRRRVRLNWDKRGGLR
jgi:hypothetical protein